MKKTKPVLPSKKQIGKPVVMITPAIEDKAKALLTFGKGFDVLHKKFVAESLELAKANGLDVKVLVDVGFNPESLV